MTSGGVRVWLRGVLVSDPLGPAGCRVGRPWNGPTCLIKLGSGKFGSLIDPGTLHHRSCHTVPG